MYGSTMHNNQSSPPQLFRGIRFVLLGFDPIQKSQVSWKLVQGGGIDAGRYDPNCTHVIVDKLVYDDPLCVAARQDGKILVSSLWVDHSFDVGAPVDTTSVMYTPVRDLNGIPGARSLVICLTGYQCEDREDIMTMVELMGAKVSKPLIANKVTHLICYKFEGEKYLLAKKMKRIKLINHRWLEDCLKAWKIVPEEDYCKSGYELEMEAEAKDSEDEPEGVTTRHNDGKITSPHHSHSLLSKQEIPTTISNTSASNLFSNAQETVSVTMKTKSGQSPNAHEIKDKRQDTENIASYFTSELSNRYEKTISRSPAQNNLISASISANKSPQNEARSYYMKDPIGTSPSNIDMKSNTSSAKRLNKLNFSDAFNMSSSLVQKTTPYNSPAFRPEDEQNDVSSNKKLDISGGSFKPQQISQNNDVESPFQEVKKDTPIEKSPARTPSSNIYGRKSSSSNGKNVISDVPISRTSTSEIEDLNAVQRPQTEYNETSLSTKFNNRDVDMSENAMHSPSAVSSDIQKSTLNLEINEQSAGSNSKPVRKKSISKKLSGSKLTKKNTVNQKGSIFLKNTDPVIDDENLFKYQQSEKVSPVAKSGTEMKTGVISGMQVDIMSENKALCMDDETEPPDDKDEAGKEKLEDDVLENTVNVLMEEKAEGNVDSEDLVGEIPLIRKGKKLTALSMKEVTDNKSDKKNELVIDDGFEIQEIREEATPNRAKRARNIVHDLEKPMEVKRVGVCNDLEHSNDVNADMDIENVVNKKETNRNKRSLGKVIIDVSKRYGTDLEKSVEVKKSGVCNDPERNNGEKGDEVNADMDIENAVNVKENNRNKRSLSKGKKDVSKRSGTDLEKSVEVKKSGASNDHMHNHDEKGDDGDADMDEENVVNKKETSKNKRSLSKTKKDVSNRSGTDLDKSVQVKKSDASNNNEHNNDEKDADMENQNVVNRNETKRNKRPLSKTKKDVTKRIATDLEKSVEVERAEAVGNDPEHTNEEKDEDAVADMDIESVVNEKETQRNKRPLSKTKKGTSKRKVSDLEKSVEVKDNDNDGADKDADVDTENVLNKKETKSNKRPLSRTKKDATKAVNKKGKPTCNQAVETCDVEEAQKENVQIHVNDQSNGKKLASKPAKEVLEKNCDKGDSNVLKDEPMWFILTGHRLQRKEFQQIIKRLKGRVCRVTHNWSYQATHFIVPDPIRRTEKFFAAAASGRWILKTDYLSASNQAGKFVAEEPYEWHKNGLSEDGQISLEAPRKWRLMKEKTGHGAFYGMKIVVYGECIVPPLDTLKRAVKAGDGTILATSPPYTRFLNSGIDFAVVSPGMPHVDVWVQEFLKYEIPCVFADYLVEYVCKPGYPLEKHVQYGTNAWAERSYNNLQNRYEADASEPETPESNDVACEVCGSRDRGEEMLICGDEGGSIGCGVGTHIDCCDPPFDSIPEEDWFCSKCSKNNSKNKKGGKNKGK
ncbi:BRCT domain-containing protein At4g02110-like [Bidens hawaiensis]|uniref:BRCT domain-containing protein At4g02110-like n=1 Tax=Bidens hawaiensis TaxID=980011 RepID=UPI00404ADD2F